MLDTVHWLRYIWNVHCNKFFLLIFFKDHLVTNATSVINKTSTKTCLKTTFSRMKTGKHQNLKCYMYQMDNVQHNCGIILHIHSIFECYLSFLFCNCRKPLSNAAAFHAKNTYDINCYFNVSVFSVLACDIYITPIFLKLKATRYIWEWFNTLILTGAHGSHYAWSTRDKPNTEVCSFV